MKTRTKIVPCFYCHEEFEVHINQANTKSVCPDCKKEGKKSPTHTKEYVEKVKNTMLKKYGVTNAMHSTKIKNKLKNTNIKRYGVSSPFKNKDVQEKIKNINMKKYGVEYPMQNKDILEKRRKSNLKKYGTYEVLKNEDVIQKRKHTIKEKYGVDHISQIPEVKEKKRQVCLNKYGVDNHMKSEQMKEYFSVLYKQRFLSKLNIYLDYMDLEIVNEYDYELDYIVKELLMLSDHIIVDLPKIKCEICGKEFNKVDGNHTMKSHGITFVEYKERFPNVPTITQERYDKELVNIQKRRDAHRNINKNTKIVPCFNCRKEFEVNINASNTKSLCTECKQKGITNPMVTEETKQKRRKACIEKYGVSNPSQSQEIKDRKKETSLKNFGVENPSQSKEVQQKMKDTIMKNYGIYNPMYSEELKEKQRQTIINHYGVSSPLKSKEVLNKLKQTNLERRGVEFPTQSKEVIEKSKATVQEKYGVDNISNLEEIKEKKRQTSLKNYGTENPNSIQVIKDKIKKTNMDKYGVEYSLQSEKVKEKSKQTCQEKYGAYYPTKSKEVKEKVRTTCQEKYGIDNIFQSPEVQEKTKQVCQERYGVDYFLQADEVRDKINKTYRKNHIRDIIKLLDYCDLNFVDGIDVYKGAHTYYNFKCKKCGNVFKQIWNSVQQGYKCPICFPRPCGYSKGELEVRNFVESLGFEVISNSRSIIAPLELDIYIPSKQVAIEYNGLYWHSEEIRTDPNYHLNKTNECEKKGIQLIHIFEDEWIFKQEIVKSRLRQILDVSEAIRIHARKCTIKEIDPKIKNEFLQEFHIQGQDNSTIKLGAFFQDELVSVMTFSYPSLAKGQKNKQEGIWELNRFCSNPKYHIPGIASKLLSHFKSHYEWNQIYSYADRRWSDGNLYHKLGFELDHITQPNYWYTFGFERIHRFGLRKRPDEPKNIPEYILRSNEGYMRVWDCGNMKFLLEQTKK